MQALGIAHSTVAQVILDAHFSAISGAMAARRQWLGGKVAGQRQLHSVATEAMRKKEALVSQRAVFKREVNRTRLRLRSMFGRVLSPVGGGARSPRKHSRWA